MNWINILDKKPEDDPDLIISSTRKTSPERTKKLIVLTDSGTVTDNFRLRMAVGEKEWVWYMGYEGDEVTHWAVFEEPEN